MRQNARKALAARLAEGSIVLLKNEGGLLPLAAGRTVAIFGRAQIGTLFSGNGSGGANVSGCQTLLDACEEEGLIPEPLLKGFYAYKIAADLPHRLRLRGGALFHPGGQAAHRSAAGGGGRL